MNELLHKRIATESGIHEVIEALADRISGSDLNSLLLEVFHRKSARITPSKLLDHYQNNRFVQPSEVDAIRLVEFCLNWQKAALTHGFAPISLSPVSPLGTCSALATAHQNKIISALRGTEVVADSTNVLALESVVRRKKEGYPAKPLCFSALHRHVRAQEIPNLPGFSAHFCILGLTSAGRDLGDFNFEKESLRQHIHFYKSCFEKNLGISPIKIRLFNLHPGSKEDRLFQSVYSFLLATEPDWLIDIIESNQHKQAYYHRLQFKIVIPDPIGGEIEIADGGFTNWTQRLAGNQKERLLISGIGLELLYKMVNGLV